MTTNSMKKCNRCNKMKNDLELCGGDLCQACEVQNAVVLTKIQYTELQDHLQELWAAHKRRTNEVVELKLQYLNSGVSLIYHRWPPV